MNKEYSEMIADDWGNTKAYYVLLLLATAKRSKQWHTMLLVAMVVLVLCIVVGHTYCLINGIDMTGNASMAAAAGSHMFGQ